jgi:hypothetical protein
MSEHEAQVTRSTALTPAEVTHLVGDLDDATITAILLTGATYSDVEQACMWALGDVGERGREGQEPGAVATAVYDILMSDPTFLGIEREE